MIALHWHSRIIFPSCFWTKGFNVALDHRVECHINVVQSYDSNTYQIPRATIALTCAGPYSNKLPIALTYSYIAVDTLYFFCFTWTRETTFIILTSFANINVKTVNWITKGKSLLLEKKHSCREHIIYIL